MSKCSVCKKKLRGLGMYDPCGNCVMEIGKVAISCRWTIKGGVVHRPCHVCHGSGKVSAPNFSNQKNVPGIGWLPTYESVACTHCGGGGLVPALADDVLRGAKR